MSMHSRQRATLRGEAHHLTPAVHIGQHGVTPAVMQTVDDSLRTQELVKVQVVRNADTSTREAAGQLAAQLNAEVVQVIGRTFTLYRHNPTLVRREGDPPPWRRG